MDWQNQDYCTLVYETQTARYWSSTSWGTNGAYYYIPIGTPGIYQDNRYVGKAVRLVQNHDGSDLFPVMADANNALFSWTSVPNAESYVLHVYKDSAHTEEVFYITFDRDGIVTGLHFVHSTPARKTDSDGVETDRMFFYTLNDLQANTDYWYTITASDSRENILYTFSGSFKTLGRTVPTAVESSLQSEQNRSKKVLINGKCLIEYNGKRWNMNGQYMNQ